MATPPPVALWQCRGLPCAGYAAALTACAWIAAVVRILALKYQEMGDVQEGSTMVYELRNRSLSAAAMLREGLHGQLERCKKYGKLLTSGFGSPPGKMTKQVSNNH